MLCFLTVLFGGKRSHGETKNVGGKRPANVMLRRHNATKMRSGGKETKVNSLQCRGSNQPVQHCALFLLFPLSQQSQIFYLITLSKPEIWRNVNAYEEMCISGLGVQDKQGFLMRKKDACPVQSKLSI